MSNSYLTMEVQWALVDQVFENGHDCTYCPHLKTYPHRDDEPGGRECHLMFNVIGPAKADPTLCPGYGRRVDRFDQILSDDLMEEVECQEAWERPTKVLMVRHSKIPSWWRDATPREITGTRYAEHEYRWFITSNRE